MERNKKTKQNKNNNNNKKQKKKQKKNEKWHLLLWAGSPLVLPDGKNKNVGL